MRPSQLTSLFDFIHAVAEQNSTRIAVIESGVEHSYEALMERADFYARALIDEEIKGDAVVGLCFTRSFEMIAAMLGILKSGNAYLPLDPGYPVERLAYMIEDSGATVVIGNESGLSILSNVDLHGVHLLSSEQLSPKALTSQSVKAPELAYLIYTSGTTGKPKGVAVGHNQVGHLIDWIFNETLTLECERTLQFAPLSFDPSVLEIFTTLAAGKTLVLINEQERKDPEALLDFLIENKIERAVFPSAILQLLAVEALESSKFPQSLKTIFCGGEAMKISREYIEFFKAIPGLRLHNQYGPTEATVTNTALILTDDPETWPELPSIGIARGSNILFVVDSSLNPLADGQEGELIITGPMLAVGYWKRPELTAEKFITLAIDGVKIRGYRTGDLVIRDANGEIQFRGRIDEQVKVNGVRVELGELESRILTNDGVREVAVKKVESNYGAALVAFYVGEAKEEELRSSLIKSLPAQIVPAAVVKREELPMTTNGKVNKKALPQRLEEIVKTKKASSSTNSNSLRGMYSQILGHEDFNNSQTFFEAGGTSLQAIALAKKLRRELQISLPIALFFENSSIDKLSKIINGESESRSHNRSEKLSGKKRGVAIVGMACRFPGAESLEAYWNLLKEGKGGIKFFKDSELDSTVDPEEASSPQYVKARGVLNDIDLFDAKFFDLSPRVAELMDPQMRLMLEESVHALEHAGVNPSKTDDRIGVFYGMNNNAYYMKNVSCHPKKIKSLSEWTVSTLNEKDYIATQVAHKLNLKGPALSIHTACSTSLVAIAEAYKAIERGDCEIALAGAINADAARNTGHLYQEGGIRSIDGHCRPFDAEATGTVFSDGVGIVVLKDLELAIADGDEIHAVIKGVGVNNDGSDKMSFTAPSLDGQKKALQMAINDASIDPSTVEMIECHGTATPIGDPIEFMALRGAYGSPSKEKEVYLGSVKSNIGHAVTAAGVAGVIKTVLSLKNAVIPATLHFKTPNPELSLEDSGYRVSTENVDWAQNANHPRRAGVSAFGVGGTNAHIILEEYQVGQESEPKASNQAELFIFSAKSLGSLKSMLESYKVKASSLNLSKLAKTLALKNAAYSVRAALVASNLEEFIQGLESELLRLESGSLKKRNSNEVAFVFPGQGAQYKGMGRELYHSLPIFKATCDELFEVLEGSEHANLKSVMFDTTEASDLLSQTFYTQPALYIFELAVARVLLSMGLSLNSVLGHSVGEFAGMVLADILSAKEALLIICERAKMMNNLEAGRMLSVRASRDKLQEVLPSNVQLAAHNSPNLCVVAGSHAAIEAFEEKLTSLGIIYKALVTSHAFHSEMMTPMVSELTQFVKQQVLKSPSLKVVSTLSGEVLTNAPEAEYFGLQASRPVEFLRAVGTLVESFEDLVLIDIGPRNIMATLARQITKGNSQAGPIVNLSLAKDERTTLLQGVAQLWNLGLDLELEIFFEDQTGLCVSSLVAYPFEQKSYWLENLNHIETKSYLSRGMQVSTKDLLKNDLINLFAESSGFSSSEIAADQNFLELGLDSLLLTQIAIEIEKTFGVKVTFRDLIDQHSTIAILTNHLDAVMPASQKAKYSAPAAPVAAAPVAPVAPAAPAVTGQAPVMPAAPIQFSAPTVASSTLESIVLGQMQLMQAHLQMLSGVGVSQTTVAPAATPNLPAVTEVAAPVEPAPIAKPLETSTEEVTETKATVNTSSSAFGAQARINTVKGSDDSKVSAAVAAIIERYSKQLKGSKEFTQKYRQVNADPRVVTGFRPELKEMTFPVVVNRSKDQHLWDIDGNEYIDMTCGFGSNFFGNQNPRITAALHDQLDRGFEIGPQHELVGECAELVCEFTGLDRAAFCNTGSEAVLGALRVARTVTGRKKIVSFKGSYHGINDEVIVRGLNGGKAMPAAAGINRSSVSDIIVLDYGTEEALAHIRANISDIAAVICEPVQSRRSDFRPLEFLKAVRELTSANGAALIFDEVITGFRIAKGGCQEYFGIKADLATYGKIVGGGMPIGVIAGVNRFMDALDGGQWSFGDDSVPTAPLTYFAGTFVRHPLALRAMREALLILKEGGRELYENINKRANGFVSEINLFCQMMGAPIHVDNFGGVLKPRSTDAGPYNDLFYALMRLNGVHVYDGFPWFVTLAHSDEDLSRVISIFKKCVGEMQELGLFAGSKILTNEVKNHDKISAEDFLIPPVPEAKLGRDELGMPAWFIPDANNPGMLKKIQ